MLSMKKPIKIIYDIVNSDEDGLRAAKYALDEVWREIRHIRDIAEIRAVEINCHQFGEDSKALQEFDELKNLQKLFNISELTIKGGHSTKKSLLARKNLDELKRLHEELRDQIYAVRDDPEAASSEMQSIYDAMDIELEALEREIDNAECD